MAKKNDTVPFGLHLPKKGKTYVYDFVYPPGGPRYSKSTRCRDYRDALKVAAKRFAEVEEAYKLHQRHPDAKPEMLVRVAFGRYYKEHGQSLSKPKEILSKLTKVALALGPDRFLSDLSANLLLQYRTERAKKVAPRTVNGDIIDLLRPFFKHARMWKVELGELGDRNFEWNQLKLETPSHRTRTYSKKEQSRLFDEMREDYEPIIRFALMTGLRKAAWFIKRSQIDWDNNVIFYKRKSKKANNVGVIAMTKAMRALLRAEIEKSGNGTEWVFTYEARRTFKGKVKGQRYPITYAGVSSYMNRLKAKPTVNLKDATLHDLRHTAATETLRASKNLVAVSMMLGHSDVSQTSRYTNLIVDDVAAALEARDALSHEFSHENGKQVREG